MADEKIVLGVGTQYPLNGILTIPNEIGEPFPDEIGEPFPAVVLVHGSGPSDMDEHIGNNYPFRDLAEGLSEKGIAVIRYDKRTFAHGKQMKNDTSISVREETIEDAILASDFLRKDSRINPNRIFIIGHSLGGMLAPRIDAEGGDFAGIIIMAGSPRKLEEIMMEQNGEVLKSLNRILRIIAKRQIAALSSKFGNIYNLSDEEAKATKILGKYVRSYYFKEMGSHPSSQYLEELEKPLFILQGSKDFQVSVERDFEEYRRILGGGQNVAFKLYPNLNHLFMPSVYGEILKAKKEYKVAQHIDKQVITDIADWMLSV